MRETFFLKKGKKNKENITVNIDKDFIINIAANSDVYENISIDNKLFIPLMLSGSNGIYFFIYLSEEENIYKTTNLIKTWYGLYHCDIYVYIINETGYYLIGKDGKALIEIYDIYTAFENMYENTQLPYMYYRMLKLDQFEQLIKPLDELEELMDDAEVEDTGDISYVKPIISRMIVEKIERINEKEQHYTTVYIDNNTKQDEDGTVYVKKYEKVKYLGFIKEKKWYRCADVDPNKVFILTMLGGWFGAHKFREGKIWSGIFYLLTCGGCGVFYIFDLIEMITGSRSYEEISYEIYNNKVERNKELVYYKKISRNKLAWIAVPIAVLASFLLINTLYKELYYIFIQILNNLIPSDVSEGVVEEKIKTLNKIIK